MKKDFWKYGNLVAFIFVIVINVMATFGMIGGVSTREVSYMYRSLLTPADFAFSIWSVIYVLLAIMVFLQIKRDDISDKLGYLFSISCILNIAWIFAWQFKMIALSFILIFALLLDLIMLMSSMKDSDSTVSTMAVGLYTGWINVAMLANLGAIFTRYNWNLFGMKSSLTAIIGLVFGLLWISFFLYMNMNPYYAIGASWGYLGIAIASSYLWIKIVALTCMVIFAGSAIFTMLKKRVDVKPKY